MRSCPAPREEANHRNGYVYMKTLTRVFRGMACGLLSLQLLAVEKDMIVSPNVINTSSKGPPYIMVHANVPLLLVEGVSLRITASPAQEPAAVLAPAKLLVDDCGDLLAKFDRDDVLAAMAGASEGEFQLTVLLLDGSEFAPSCIVSTAPAPKKSGKD